MAVRSALVVGAGLAGPAVAHGLAARGVDVTWIERRGSGPVPGAGILLTGNAVAALDALGLGGPVRDAGRAVHRIAFADARDRTLFEVPVARPGWPPFVTLSRTDLRGVLLGACAAAPRMGTTLSTLDADALAAGEGVRATLSDGDAVTADLLVGADGLRSDVRQRVFDRGPPEPIPGFAGWRFLAPRPPSLVEPRYLLGDGRTLLLHPLPGERVYCGAGPVAGADPGGDDDPREGVRAAFAGFGGVAREVLDALDRARELRPTRYWHLELPAWRRGACVLVGDAAHACAPTLAQGGAMAFEDAQVLCEVLDRAGPRDEALAAFEARRRPRVVHAQRESRARMEANRPLESRRRAMRDTVLRRIGAGMLVDAWAPLLERRP